MICFQRTAFWSERSCSRVLYTALFIGVLLVFDGLLPILLAWQSERRRSIDAACACLGRSEEVLRLLRRRRLLGAWSESPDCGMRQALVIQSGISMEAGRLLAILLLGAADSS